MLLFISAKTHTHTLPPQKTHLFPWCWGQYTFAFYHTYFHLAKLLCSQTIISQLISTVVFQPNYSTKIRLEMYPLGLLLLLPLAVALPFSQPAERETGKRNRNCSRTEHGPLSWAECRQTETLLHYLSQTLIYIHSGEKERKMLGLYREHHWE